MPHLTPRSGPIKVFLVDDSPLALVMLKRMIATAPDILVVGTARDGREALALFATTQPDVICTDYVMPHMDGLALIEHAMAEFPRPILVISSVIDPKERDKAIPLLAAGAIDVFAKPDSNTPFEASAAQLCQKIRILSGIVVISRRPSVAATLAASKPPTSLTAPLLHSPLHAPLHQKPVAPHFATRIPPRAPLRIVAIGASTGGPQTLQSVLSSFPSDFRCPILCVQHISNGFLAGLVTWLDGQCHLHVKIAESGEIASAGTVYFPPENRHLEIDARGRLSASDAPAIDGHKPSVTTTFESVARSYGRAGAGILLTGMGSDGATGLEALFKAGGVTFAQNEASCVVFGMPKQAIARGAAQYILPPAEIAASVLQMIEH